MVTKKALDGLREILSPKTLKSIKFIQGFYKFSEIKQDEEIQENVRMLFNRICSQKNYIPNKEIFLSKKLIDDIFEIDYEMDSEEEEIDSESDSDEIERCSENFLEKIWQKIREKHAGEQTPRVILNEKFINSVFETYRTIYFDEFTAEMDRLEQNIPHIPPQKKKTIEEKIVSLEKELTSKRNSRFEIYFVLAKLMEGKKDYDSALNYLASALSSLSPIFKNGKPEVWNYGDGHFGIRTRTCWFNSEYVFEHIIDVFSKLAKIQGRGNPETVKEIIKLGSSFIDTLSSWMLSVPDYRRDKIKTKTIKKEKNEETEKN